MSTIATEVLYNGIKLDVEWPPRNQNVDTFSAFDAPYLENPPHIIPIDIGRQLFVDDFLIEETDCVRFFVKPKIHPSSPILIPETYEEMDEEIVRWLLLLMMESGTIHQISYSKCGTWRDGFTQQL